MSSQVIRLSFSDSSENKAAERKKELQREERKNPTMFQQWSQNAGMFTPVGNTIPKIEPGYYDVSVGSEGIFFIPVRPRDDYLMEFPDSASVTVLEGIADFWDREQQFLDYGIPHKRGVLLYGPPGSGKSCTLQLVARDVVRRGGIVINFPSSSAQFIAAYRALRDIQPDIPVVVLMEDFEVLLQSHDESKILNLLDGVENLSRVVFLATTNYPERLKDRIVNRPSRFDLRILVGHPSIEMRRQYLANLVHDDDDLDIDKYARDTEGMSLSHLKELFVATHLLGADYAATVRRLLSMKTKVTSLEDGTESSESYGNYN